MPLDFNTAFGLHERALNVRAQRAELLASNLSNADTPGYKARDLNFQQAMAQADSSLDSTSMAVTQAGHLPGMQTSSTIGLVQYRNPSQPSLDGNTVDSQLEKSAFAKNSMEFQASLTFLNGKIKGLMTAICGD